MFMFILGAFYRVGSFSFFLTTMTMSLVLVISWIGLDLTMDIEGFLTKARSDVNVNI